MEKFTASEISRQSERILIQINRFENIVNSTAEDINTLASTIKSEDSNLAERLNKDESSLRTLKTSLNTKFRALAVKMDEWAKKTIENEQDMAKETDEIDNIVNEINELVKSTNPEEI